MSFRLKTILGIALIEAVLLAFLIFSVLGYLHDSNEAQLLDRTSTTADLLSTAVKDAVIASDLATIESILDAVMTNPGLVFSRVYDNDGILLASRGDPERMPKKYVEHHSSEEATGDIFNASADVLEEGINYGTVQLGFNIQLLRELLKEAREHSISIAIIEMLLVGLFSTFLGIYLTRQLKRLRDASDAVASGELGYQIEAKGKDEISQTINAFNRMSSVIHKDVELLEQAKREITLARDEAQKADKAKSEFLSSMSHELRTPLNAIIGFSDLLEMELQEASQLDDVQEIKRAGEHLLSLINQVLDLSKIEAGKFDINLGTVELDPLLDECLQMIRPLQQRNHIEIEKHFAVENVLLKGDYIRVKQVVINLLTNAIKYNKPEGKVILSVEKVSADYCRITIADTGIGISDSKMQDLFKPFNRLHGDSYETEGTGIGLVISKSLVELMAGTIEVNSEPGVGSQFVVTLPVSHDFDQDTSEQLQSVQETKPTSAQTQKTILYIEDNPANLRLVEKCVKRDKHQYQLHTAVDGASGIESFIQHQPDLLLLDINLPDINGIEVLKQLRETHDLSSIPVIAVTANAMKSDLDLYMDAGFTECITKPIDVHNLAETLSKYLN